MELPAESPVTAHSSEAPLDAYSRVVTAVARTMTPHVAALTVTSLGRDGRARQGAGSAVVFTTDGFMLTNAHVVAGATHGEADFADGTGSEVDVVGADPLSDLAVVRVRGSAPPPATLGAVSYTHLTLPTTPYV